MNYNDLYELINRGNKLEDIFDELNQWLDSDTIEEFILHYIGMREE